ncbi:MAG: lycopene cyclase domain-containing protein [Chloroflexota bacterium]
MTVPEYTVASVVVLAGALVAAAWQGLLRRRSTWLGLAIFGGATVVADLVLTGLPIVTYGDHHVRALMLGPMPLEDLLYGFALFLVAASAWQAVGGRRRSAAAAARRTPAPPAAEASR